MDAKPPLGLKWRSSTLFILATITIGMFTDLLLYGMAVPILPFILSDRIAIPHSEIQINTSLLLACFAGASVISSLPIGIISDRLSSRQVPFILGLLVLGLATALLLIGDNIWILRIARILQGVSGAVVWVVGMALVMDTVGSAKLGVTLGSLFSFTSVGELFAPILGGTVYEKFGAYGVLTVSLAILAIDLIMRLLLIEKKVAARYNIIDNAPPSASESQPNHDEVPTEESPLIARSDDQSNDWTLPEELPRWAQSFPIIYCHKNSRLLSAQLVSFTQASLLGAFDSTVATQSQDLFGFSPLNAGLVFVPMVLPYLVLGPLAGRMVDKYGTKPACVIGFSYLALPLVLLRLPLVGGGVEIANYCVVLALCGCGLAIISSPSLVEASEVVENYYRANKDLFGENGPYAQLYAVNTVFFCLGLTVGPLVAGTLRDSIGYGNMNAVIAGWCILVAIVSFFFIGRPRDPPKSS